MSKFFVTFPHRLIARVERRNMQPSTAAGSTLMEPQILMLHSLYYFLEISPTRTLSVSLSLSVGLSNFTF